MKNRQLRLASLVLILSFPVQGFAADRSEFAITDAASVLQLLSQNRDNQSPKLMQVDCHVLLADDPVDTDRHITLKVLVDKNKAFYHCDDQRPNQSNMPQCTVGWSFDGKDLRYIRSENTRSTPILAQQHKLAGSMADAAAAFPGIVGDFIDPQKLGYGNSRLMMHSIGLQLGGHKDLEEFKLLAADADIYETSTTESILNGQEVVLVTIRTRQGKIATDGRSPLAVSIFAKADSMLPIKFTVVAAEAVTGLDQPSHSLLQESNITWDENNSSKYGSRPKLIEYRQYKNGTLNYHEKMSFKCPQEFESGSVPDEAFDWAALSPNVGQPVLFDGENVMRIWDGSDFRFRGVQQNVVTAIPLARSRQTTWWLVLNILVLPFVLAYLIRRNRRGV